VHDLTFCGAENSGVFMSEKKKNLGGRPSEFKPEYCSELIKHMEEGLSFESFAGVVGCCKQTLYTWCENHPEFLDSKKKAFEKNRLFWEKVGVQGMFMGGNENPFNATVWIFNMKNRFNWRDKQEVENIGEAQTKVTVYLPEKKDGN
jgi:hypothetical protein